MNIPYTLGNQTITELIQYCQANQFDKFFVLADDNTYQALGEKVVNALRAQAWNVVSLVYPDAAVVPNEVFIVRAMHKIDTENRIFIAVGSGVVTDITRFVSYCNRRPFISLPTAASVDGYTSPSSSLVLENVKTTVISQPPMAIFADLPTLVAAPHRMAASGFGDILGKYIALADWKLGRLLWDEPYDAPIVERVQTMLDATVAAATEIGQATPHGIKILMDSLIDSGICMLDFGNSRPAAASEHYMSHSLELKLLEEGRPAVLHGAKVGMSAVVVARLYEELRGIAGKEALKLLEDAVSPDRAQEETKIRQAYPKIADKLIPEQAPFLALSEQGWDQLKQRIANHWDEIQAIANQVPSSTHLAALLRQAGAAVEPVELELSNAEVYEALQISHYLRNRFTICKLKWIMNW